MITSDVVVIGGGMAGISAAALIAEDANVTVLEAEAAIGYHATGRSASVFIPNRGNKNLRAICAAAAPLLAQPEGVSETALIRPRGRLLIADKYSIDHFDIYANEAPGAKKISLEEAGELVPILKTEGLIAALYDADVFDIDVHRMLEGYARLLIGRGGRIETGAEAEKIERTNGVWTVTTRNGAYSAPILVNAAGAWADYVAELAGIAPLGLLPLRRTAAVVPSPPTMDISKWPFFGPVDLKWYAKPDAGRIFISPADDDLSTPQDAWPDDMALAEGLNRFENAVKTRTWKVEHSWAGLSTFTPDLTPVVGFAGEDTGFLWLAGQGGDGIQTAPVLAALAADLCAQRIARLPQPVVEALSPERVF